MAIAFLPGTVGTGPAPTPARYTGNGHRDATGMARTQPLALRGHDPAAQAVHGLQAV
ncbi:MAG TPA: hypothetical protein VMQ59_06130 [Acidimicrobiales bacterium]|nr:hypothetical protein [Acidimicrobiales bacterium]